MLRDLPSLVSYRSVRTPRCTSAVQYGAMTVDINGEFLPFCYDDGFQVVKQRSFTLTPQMIAAANLAGQIRMTFDHRAGYDANDAYTAYLRMGSPASLTPDQLRQLQAATTDRPGILTVTVGVDGKASVPLPMRTNDVVLVEIRPTSDG